MGASGLFKWMSRVGRSGGAPRETSPSGQVVRTPLELLRSRMTAISGGGGRVCVFCEKAVDAWRPYYLQPEDLSDFQLRVGVVGSNTQRFYCPHCESYDRERHLRLYFEAAGIFAAVSRSRILHVAPERRLGALISAATPLQYVQGDLNPTKDGVDRIDLHRLPYLDSAFDMVICNHILEHVDDVPVVLSEISRVLAPGGRFVCQTPYAANLMKTFSDPLHRSDDDRLFFYGQHDHVRLFGRDIVDQLVAGGFRGSMVPHEIALPGFDGEIFGVNEHEPFFDFERAS